MVYQCLARFQDLLFPPRCRLCGDRSPRADRLCPPCTDELPWLEGRCTQCARPVAAASRPVRCGGCQRSNPAFDATAALFHYQPPVDYLLKQLKFSSELSMAPLLAGLLARQLAWGDKPLPGLLVPVPLHVTRLRERGFNQAAELARVLGRQLQIPVDQRLCRRRRATGTQSRLPPAARRLNVRRAFEVSKAVTHCHIAIVDDVMTTGHTANELARVLKQAGAERVEVWVIARAGAA